MCLSVCVRGRVVLSKTTMMILHSFHPYATLLMCKLPSPSRRVGKMKMKKKEKQTRGRYLSPSLSLAAASATATDMVEWRHPRGVVVERRSFPFPLCMSVCVYWMLISKSPSLAILLFSQFSSGFVCTRRDWTGHSHASRFILH